MAQTKRPSLIAAESPEAIIDVRDGDDLREQNLRGSVKVPARSLTTAQRLELDRLAAEDVPGQERVVASDPHQLGMLPTQYTVLPPREKAA